MTTPQLNRLSMYRSLRDFLPGQTEIIGKIEVLPAIVADFMKNLAAIESGASKQNSVTAGKTDIKHDAEERLFNTMILVADSLRTYATRNKQLETLAKASLEKWRLNRLRDSELSTQAGIFLDEAMAHSPEVAQYGITETVLQNFRDAIASYTKSLDTRESSLADRKVTRTDIRILFAKTDSLLEDELDAMVEHFREAYPAFYDNYYALRITKALGMRHHGAAAMELVPANGGNGGATAPAVVPVVLPEAVTEVNA